VRAVDDDMTEAGTNLVIIPWLFVTFGDSGSRKQNGHERGEGADWKTLVNQGRNGRSLRDELSHHLVFTKNDEEPGGLGHVCD
jgi:hypothetical protein